MIKYIKENHEDIIEIPIEYVKGATLLSPEECEKYRNNIPKASGRWWTCVTKLPSYYSPNKCYAEIYGVRPALQICNLEFLDLEIGDKIGFGGHSFTIISNDLAICDDFIGESCFRKDWKAKDANVYEKSDIKEVVDEWFFNKKQGLKSNKEMFDEDDWGF